MSQSTTHARVPRVGVIGVNGHGRVHALNLATRSAQGELIWAAVCDTGPLGSEVARLADQHGAERFTSYARMLGRSELDVVVIATPPHLHLSMAVAAMQSGADVLVEKPATVSSSDLEDLIRTGVDTGCLSQIGYQSVGTAASSTLLSMVSSGRLGEIRAVSAGGAWSRTPGYFHRGAWTGRRYLDGVPVNDGALANPFNHAVLNGLRVLEAANAAPASVDLELYRLNDIETDDTSSLVVHTSGEATLRVTVTLAADRVAEPYLLVRGSAATARWDYTRETLRVEPTRCGTSAPWTSSPSGPAPDLLQDLLEVRRGVRTRLLMPASDCVGVMAISDVLLNSDAPTTIGPEFGRWQRVDAETEARTLPGVGAVVERSVHAGLTLGEVGPRWTTTQARQVDLPLPVPAARRGAVRPGVC